MPAKYRILIERKGQDTELQFTSDDGRIFLAEFTEAELWNLYQMCDVAQGQIYSMLNLKGNGKKN